MDPPEMPAGLAELLRDAEGGPTMAPEDLAKIALRLEKTLSIPTLDVPLRDQMARLAREAPRKAIDTGLGAFIRHRATMGIGLYLAGIVTGGVVQHELTSGRTPTVALAPAPLSPPVRPTAEAEPWVTLAPPSPVPVAVDPSATPSAATSPSSAVHPAPRSRLTEERQLLEVARAALARSRPTEALAALDEHARRFPAGELDEETLSLRVDALVASGSYEDARATADRFNAKYPDSLLRASVRHALQTIP